MKSFILLIGDEGALLYPPSHIKKEPLFMSTHEKDSFSHIRTMLDEAPHMAVHILVDIRTQHIRKEDHPALSYFDRKKLLERRIKQAFPKTRLRSVLPQNKTEALLISLDETPLLETYLDLLRNVKNPLSGISLLPCELESLVSKLIPNPSSHWCMLLLYQQTGGFRQIVTHKGKLIFTRLTPPLPETTSADFVEERLTQDILATRNYLGRFGLKRRSKFSVVAIMPAHLSTLTLDHCEATILSPSNAAHQIHLPYPHHWNNGADLLSLLWARASFGWKSRLFLPEDKTRFYNDIIRYVGFSMALLIFAIALIRISLFGFSVLKNYHETTQLRQDVAELNDEFETLQESMHAPSSDLDALRMAVEKERFYTQNIDTPEEILSYIDSLTEKQARAHKVTWQQNKIEIELNLTRAEKMTRSDILMQYETLKTTLEKEIPDYSVTISNYPFPNLPTDTITNKGLQKDEARATFLLTKKKGGQS